jgi:hypothetical protein
MQTKPKIAFIGLAQNCAQHLPAVLRNIENMATLASESAFLFLENDSTDNTKAILSGWGNGRPNFTLLNFDGLNSLGVRTVKLEILRNTCVECLRTYKNLKDFDLVISVDMDDVAAWPIDLGELSKAIQFVQSDSQHAGVFANQLGTYYDIWALRHKTLCPGDAWEEVIDFKNAHPEVSNEEAFNQTFKKRIPSFSPTEKPIEVDSAFGGLGVYRMSYILKNPNPYLGYTIKSMPSNDGSFKVSRRQYCEHVHFHAGIRSQGGKLFIWPSLINGEYRNVTFPHYVQLFF